MNEDAKNYLSNQLIPTIKGMAYEKIVAFLPETAQSNCNARMNELNLARFDRALVASELAEIASMQVLWNRARAIRAASNAHEAALMQMETIEQVKAHDYMAGWPGE